MDQKKTFDFLDIWTYFINQISIIHKNFSTYESLFSYKLLSNHEYCSFLAPNGNTFHCLRRYTWLTGGVSTFGGTIYFAGDGTRGLLVSWIPLGYHLFGWRWYRWPTGGVKTFGGGYHLFCWLTGGDGDGEGGVGGAEGQRQSHDGGNGPLEPRDATEHRSAGEGRHHQETHQKLGGGGRAS